MEIKPNSLEKELVAALIKRYFFQLTTGCGLHGCMNIHCASCAGSIKRTPQEAAKEALNLSKQAVQQQQGQQPQIFLCLDRAEEYTMRPAVVQ